MSLSGAKLEAGKELIEVALRLLGNCSRAYKKASPTARRKYNHAFFDAIWIKDGRVVAFQYKEPFDTINASKGSSKDPQVEVSGHYRNSVEQQKRAPEELITVAADHLGALDGLKSLAG